MPMPPSLIEEQPPPTWQALQDQTARILNECGFETKTAVTIHLVRGQKEVDVHATDDGQTPSTVIFCECKHWKSTVPQDVVHSFRTVVADGGANIGYLISSSPFQSGAREAAQSTNVKLLTWEQFQEKYADRWFERHFFPLFHKHSDRLAGYSEPPPLPSIPFIPQHLREEFWTRFDRDYCGVGTLGLGTTMMTFIRARSEKSLRGMFFERMEEERAILPSELFEKKSLRGTFDFLQQRTTEAYEFADAFFEKHGLKPGGYT